MGDQALKFGDNVIFVAHGFVDFEGRIVVQTSQGEAIVCSSDILSVKKIERDTFNDSGD